MEEHAVESYQASEVTEKVNHETGEIERRFDNAFDISSLLPTAGQLELTEYQKNLIYADIDEKDVEIRPDGLIYLPWMEFANRLRQSFGAQWALIPNGMPKFHKSMIFWGFWMIIHGHLSGFAIGEQEYHPTNRTMTYGDACEGAKSNALMRLCKGIGMGLELWKPSFIRTWKDKHAENYWDDKKKRYLWRKKDSEQPTDDQPPKQPEEPFQPPPKKTSEAMTDGQRKKIYAMLKEAGLNDSQIKHFTQENGIYKDQKPTKSTARDVIDNFESLIADYVPAG